MFSHQAAPQLQQLFERDGNFPPFIFIDGDHSYKGVRQDIIDYFPLLAPGGIMVFHDYLPPLNDENREGILFHHAGNEPGIRQACEELMENTYGCEVLDIPLLYPTDPTQSQAHLPIIPRVFSTIRAYRKPQG
jgi:predicted O-methyltransferase YrrM